MRNGSRNIGPPSAVTELSRGIVLRAHFALPAAFTADEVDLVAEQIIGHTVPANSDLYYTFGPDGGIYTAYVSAITAECHVLGEPDRTHRLEAYWGHGGRCTCHHPMVDHTYRTSSDRGLAGPCMVDTCTCKRYLNRSEISRKSPEDVNPTA
jgi:hypothetical protein